MGKRIQPATVLSLAALFFSLGGASFAASRYITSLSQITPSVRHALQGARGPVGPRGAQGLAGAQGVQGPAGTMGVQGPAGATASGGFDWSKVYEVSNSVDVDPAGQDVSVKASCRYPDHLLNGGFTAADAIVTTSTESHDEWFVTAHLDPGASGTGSVYAYARCVPAS